MRQLLGEFVSHRLLAFDAVGFFQGRYVEPAFGFLSLGDDLAAIGDKAVDQGYECSGLFAFDDIGPRRVGRHEDMSFHSGSSRVGGHGSGGVSGRRHSEFLNTQFLRHRDRGGHPASLKTLRRVLPFVFYEEVEFYGKRRSKAIGFQKRRPTFAERDYIFAPFDGQNFAISPQGGFTHAKRILVKSFCGLFKIVPDKKRFSAFDAETLNHAGFVPKPAQRAFEKGDVHLYMLNYLHQLQK